jgi:hypothetical protein
MIEGFEEPEAESLLKAPRPGAAAICMTEFYTSSVAL